VNLEMDHRSPIVEHFHTFYVENKDKLHMTQSYPINWREVMRWRKHLFHHDSEFLGRVFLLALQHVPYSQFYDSLVKGALEIDEARVILVINGAMTKSSTWVALLVWPFINDKVVDIIRPEQMTTNIPDNHVYVYVDDAVYSGKQFEEAIPKDFEGTIYLLASAISKSYPTEKRLFQDMRERGVEVDIPTNSIRFLDIYQYAYDLDPGYAKPWEERMQDNYDKFQFNHTKHAIYFDHKLADAVSTMQKLLALGVDDIDEEYHFHPLITNCKPADYRFHDKRIVKSHEKVNDFDPDGVCPTAFYKNIDYTWKGHLADRRKHVIDVLKE
jgi:hypothetical protein